MFKRQFQLLLSGPDQERVIGSQDIPIPVDDIVFPPSFEEVGTAIRRLKNNKAAGSDVLAGRMHQIICQLWEDESMPDDWNISCRALSCDFFNLVLEKIVRRAKVNTEGTIFYKAVQLLRYADDIDIVARSQCAVVEAFTAIEEQAKRAGLMINEGKIKYML